MFILHGNFIGYFCHMTIFYLRCKNYSKDLFYDNEVHESGSLFLIENPKILKIS